MSRRLSAEHSECCVRVQPLFRIPLERCLCMHSRQGQTRKLVVMRFVVLDSLEAELYSQNVGPLPLDLQ